VCAAHTCSNGDNVTSVFNTPSNDQKRVELSNLKTSPTWHVKLSLQDQRHVHLGQLDKNNPDNTCLGSGAWQATSTYNSLICWGYHTRHWTNTRPHLRARQTHHPLLVKATTPDIKYFPSTWDNLLHHWTTSFARKSAKSLGGLCTVQGLQNTCDTLHGTLRHVSILHVSPGIGARTLDP